MTVADIWDAQATTYADAAWAVWAEHDPDAGVAHCLARITPALDQAPPRGSMLDLGAGIGRLAIPISRAYQRHTVWALDVSPAMLGHLAARNRMPNLRASLGDGQRIPDEVPMLAAAWSVVALQHMPVAQQVAYITQVAGRLQPGAPFVFQFVDGADPGPLSNPMETLDVIYACQAAGLDVTDVATDDRFETWRWITAVRP